MTDDEFFARLYNALRNAHRTERAIIGGARWCAAKRGSYGPEQRQLLLSLLREGYENALEEVGDGGGTVEQ